MDMNCYRTSNNKFFNAPPRMADGRHFTDYRPSCDANSSVRNNQQITSKKEDARTKKQITSSMKQEARSKKQEARSTNHELRIHKQQTRHKKQETTSKKQKRRF